VFSAVLGLLFFPFIAAILAGELGKLGVGLLVSVIVGGVAGILTFILIVWKSGTWFRKLLNLVLSGVHEPMRSCLEFGLLGALIVGGAALAAILFLGHTRPAGWELNRLPELMGVGFAIFFIVGLRVGLDRRARKNSS
jgi:hypothetical protein